MNPFSEILARVAFVVAIVATIGLVVSAICGRRKKPEVQGFHRGEFRMAEKPRDPNAPVVFIHRHK